MENALDYIKKSFELKNQGYYKPAIEMLYKALALESDNIEILAQLAHLYKLLGNFQRAIYYVEKVLELDKNHLDCLFLLKQIHIIDGNQQELKEVIERIYKIQPSQENLAEKIRILSQSNQKEKLKEIEKSGIDLKDQALYELSCSYKEENPEKALELLKAGYELNNKNENILLALAKSYYENKDFDNSKKLFTELAKLDNNAEVMNYLGLFKLNEQNYPKAIDYFLNAVKIDEKNHDYLFNLASAYFFQGWLDEAENYFGLAIKQSPNNISYHYSLAYLNYQKGLYEKSLLELETVSTLDDKHELSLVLKAMIKAKKGDLLGAKFDLEEIIKTSPNDDFALSELSKIYKELPNLEMARDTIKKAIELKPESLDYLSDLISLEIDLKNYEEAKELANKLIDKNKKFIFGHIALAKIAEALGDFDSVYEEAQAAIELDGNSPEGYYYNAIALFDKGDTNFAIESLKKSISLDLNNSALYVKMSEFYQDLGDLKTSFAWAKEASEIDEMNYQTKWLCAKLAIALKDEKEASKFYSLSYRIAPFDEDLKNDYSDFLKSIGKEKQAKALIK